MEFVLDCSVAISWCFEDESDTWSDGLLGALVAGVAWVPDLWHLEVTNILAHCERRKRLTEAQSSIFLRRLSQLPIRVAELGRDEHFSEILPLARKEGLAVYDAAYLHLALREGLPLATRDQDLKAAAQRLGVKLL